LIFNWGGTSDQVQNVSNTLRSRSHNELVVAKLKYYVDYLQQGKYNYKDVYGEIPFYLELDENKPQLFNSLVAIKFLSESVHEIRIKFETNSAPVILYTDNSKSTFLWFPKNLSSSIA
jgi:hypothetical protein